VISHLKTKAYLGVSDQVDSAITTYVHIRDGLVKAKANAIDSPEHVLNHLRTAIELAIKE
jgi:hypothetical protein